MSGRGKDAVSSAFLGIDGIFSARVSRGADAGLKTYACSIRYLLLSPLNVDQSYMARRLGLFRGWIDRSRDAPEAQGLKRKARRSTRNNRQIINVRSDTLCVYRVYIYNVK